MLEFLEDVEDECVDVYKGSAHIGWFWTGSAEIEYTHADKLVKLTVDEMLEISNRMKEIEDKFNA